MPVNRHGIRRKVVGLIIAAAALAGLSATVVKKLPYTPFDKEFYLTDEQVAFIRPGYDIEIESVEIAADRTLSAIYTVADEEGLPLDIDGVFTPGVISSSFIIGTIPQGGGQYVNYHTRTVTSPITGETGPAPGSDSGGTHEKIEDGRYRYTFGTVLPADYDPDATHTVGTYSRRRYSNQFPDLGLPDDIDNDLYTFVPSGGDVVDERELVVTDACNQCHNPLVWHGRRTETGLCILCHTKGMVDLDSGNSIDLKVMVHKIHRGADLPSVEAGIPYRLLRSATRFQDFSDVHFPQDIRNCDTCHVEEAAQAESIYLNPTWEACGSCHDDVNFATGENHVGGPQISDNLCSGCHIPQGELEFDASIMGAHTIPTKSAQLQGLNIELIEAQNTGPGEFPVVRLALTNNAGDPVDPATLNRLRLRFAGPTTDYRQMFQENALEGLVAVGDGTHTYTSTTPIPADATGSWGIGAEGRFVVDLNPGTTAVIEGVRDTSNNPVIYVPVTDAEAVPRVQVVDVAGCNECHETLAYHGGNRKNASEYCQMCHYPENIEGPDDGPGQTIHFKFMIHRIHRGEDLTRDFIIDGTNFSHVRFPGDLRDCEKCHINDTYNVPVAEGRIATPTPFEFFTPQQPNTAACLACHDTLEAAAHAFVMTAPFGESCAACHGEGHEFAVERVHAR